jgi:S1-C subfamily serine protease
MWAGWMGALLVLGIGTSVAFMQLSIPVPVANRTSTTTPPPPPETTIAIVSAPFAVTIEVTGDISDEIGLGSGIVIDDGTYILTNAHVVGAARSVSVIDGEQSRHTATVVGTDAVTNLAVLHIDGSPLVVMGDPSDEPLSVGSTVTTVLGLPDRATVIGTAQRLNISDTWRLYDLIEFDRGFPIEMTGGPLLDVEQRVAGILTIVVDDDGPGYAIPIATGLSIAGELIASGEVAHGYLGVQGLDSLLGGVEIFALPAGSALRAAGAREGDVIVGINDNDVTSSADLVALLRTYREGDNVTVEILREFENIAIEVTLDRHPES